MKANEFVKKFGWEAVIEAVKKLPENHDFQSTEAVPIEKNGTFVGFDCKVYTVSSVEVKRLVESYELVEKRGGLVKAKATLIGMSDLLKQRPVMPTLHNQFIRLKQAIADVEACKEVS